MSETKAVVYNDRTGQYVITIPGQKWPLVMSRDKWERFLRAYSNDGYGMTVNEVAREFGYPRHTVVAALRAAGHTHDSAPWTDEQWAELTDEELILDAEAARRQKVAHAVEARKWDAIKRDAGRALRYDLEIREMIQSVADNYPPINPPKPRKVKRDPFAAVVGLTDFHWGKLSVDGKGRADARKKLFSSLDDGTAELCTGGNPSRFVLPIGGDFLHVDTDKKTTTRGTPQDTDGNPADIYRSGIALAEEIVLYLLNIAPVDIRLVDGNHDRLLGVAAVEHLAARFRDCAGVTVDRKEGENARAAYLYGSTFVGMAHGEGRQSATTGDLVGHFVREYGAIWGAASHHIILTGHRHNYQVDSSHTSGAVRIQMESLSSADRWHVRDGYEGSPPALQIFKVAESGGLKSTINGRP